MFPFAVLKEEDATTGTLFCLCLLVAGQLPKEIVSHLLCPNSVNNLIDLQGGK